jgi:hypothetical protein
LSVQAGDFTAAGAGDCGAGRESLKIEGRSEPAKKKFRGRSGAVRSGTNYTSSRPFPPILPAKIYDGGGFE